MCLYSTHVPESERRNAKVGETLTVGQNRGHACLLGDDGKVTCIKSGTTLVIDRLAFVAQLRSEYAAGMTAGQPATITLKRSTRGYSADRFELSNGATATLDWLKRGSTLRIPRKVRKDAGTTRPRNLDKVLGLDQIKADIPVTEPVTIKG
jgi:hypothetical protein